MNPSRRLCKPWPATAAATSLLFLSAVVPWKRPAADLLPSALAPGIAPRTVSAQEPGPVRYRDVVFDRVERTTNLVYGEATDIPSGAPVRLALDLYEPAGDTEAGRPLLVFVHGGGFVSGDKSAGRRWAESFARRGWVAASIGYRLSQGDVMTVGVPAAVSDARQAVAWLQAHAAEHRIDVSRIAIGGSSAGAITSVFLAYTDLEKPAPDAPSGVAAVMDLWGGLYGNEEEMTAGEPPLIIVHGTEDKVVPYALAEALRDRAEAVGIPHAFHPLEGVGHGSSDTERIAGWTARFFYDQLWPTGPADPSPTIPARPSPTIPARPSPTIPARPSPTIPARPTATPGPAHAARVHLPWCGAAAPTHRPRPTPTGIPSAPGMRYERVVALLVDDGGSTDTRVGSAGQVLHDVTDWYWENSLGHTYMTFTVHGWYEIPMQAGSATDPRIYAAAVADGVDFRAYDHVLVLFHGGTGFGSSHAVHDVRIVDGDRSYSLEATVSQVTRFRNTHGTRGVIAHELGHALGLPHANHISQLTGEPVTYGTLVDTMGSSGYRGHFNAYYKHHLGWLPDASVTTVEGEGVFDLRPIETLTGTRMLVIPAAGELHSGARTVRLGAYVVETRRPLGHDAGLRHNVLDGALLYRLAPLAAPDEESGGRQQTLSLDASPETPSDTSDDFALMPGRTWSDRDNGIHITVLASTPELTRLEVLRDDGSANLPPRIRTMDLEPAEGGDNAFRLIMDADDPDGDALSVFWNLEVVADPGGSAGRGLTTRYAPGTYGHGPVVEHAFADASPRSVCAIVSDRRGGVASDCMDLFGALDVPPSIVETGFEPRGPRTVRLAAAVAEREPRWWHWDFGDGTSSAFVSPLHTYALTGTYPVRLTVFDGRHETTADLEVDATQTENVPPVAVAGPDREASPGENLRLDGAASYDPDRYPIDRLRYIWSADPPIRLTVDRSAPWIATFEAPAAAGAYTVTLQVYDGALYGTDALVVRVR